VRRIHRVIGNAGVDGTCATQLYLCILSAGGRGRDEAAAAASSASSGRSSSVVRAAAGGELHGGERVRAGRERGGAGERD